MSPLRGIALAGAVVMLFTTDIAGQTAPRFEPRMSRLITGQPLVSIAEPANRSLFYLTARASLAFDGDRVNPSVAARYSNLRSEKHPWWTEVGYRRIAADDDSLDNLFGSFSYQLRSGRSGAVDFEVDYNYLEHGTHQVDAYTVARVVPHPRLAFDMFAGVTTAKRNDVRRTDATFGLAPSWQVTDALKAAVLYAFKNEIDPEEHVEVWLSTRVPALRGSVTMAVRRQDTWSVVVQYDWCLKGSAHFCCMCACC